MSYSSDGRGLDVANAPVPDERRALNLRPLAGLVPYIARYRGRAAAAFASLIVASLTTLIVPVAVRRMIDFGFSDKAAQLIDSYFAVMLLVVAVLAVSSALRFYLVTTLGERIVADLRSDVFAHLTRLSPAYFDAERSGEIVSRLTADTTQIKSAVGASRRTHWPKHLAMPTSSSARREPCRPSPMKSWRGRVSQWQSNTLMSRLAAQPRRALCLPRS